VERVGRFLKHHKFTVYRLGSEETNYVCIGVSRMGWIAALGQTNHQEEETVNSSRVANELALIFEIGRVGQLLSLELRSNAFRRLG
jgi:hypothetical protein